MRRIDRPRLIHCCYSCFNKPCQINHPSSNFFSEWIAIRSRARFSALRVSDINISRDWSFIRLCVCRHQVTSERRMTDKVFEKSCKLTMFILILFLRNYWAFVVSDNLSKMKKSSFIIQDDIRPSCESIKSLSIPVHSCQWTNDEIRQRPSLKFHDRWGGHGIKILSVNKRTKLELLLYGLTRPERYYVKYFSVRIEFWLCRPTQDSHCRYGSLRGCGQGIRVGKCLSEPQEKSGTKYTLCGTMCPVDEKRQYRESLIVSILKGYIH